MDQGRVPSHLSHKRFQTHTHQVLIDSKSQKQLHAHDPTSMGPPPALHPTTSLKDNPTDSSHPLILIHMSTPGFSFPSHLLGVPLFLLHKRKLKHNTNNHNLHTTQREKKNMLKEEGSTLGLKSSTNWARVCDTCRSAPCTIYCRADSAYLCTGCDAQVHAANKLSSRHERVWVCEACEQAPAAFICKADAASLCTTCDTEIHSANPLARRHHRVPVMPIPGSLYGPQAADPRTIMGLGVESQGGYLSQDADETIDEEDEDEAASWLLFDAPPKNTQNQSQHQNDNGFLFNGEGGVDEYLDLVEYNSCQDNQFSDDQQFGDDQYTTDNSNNIQQQQECYAVPQKSFGGGDADSVVPVQCIQGKNHQLHHQNFQHQKFQLGMDFETSNASYGYPASLGHSVSMSSLDVGVVPDSTISEVSISHPRPPKGTIDLFSSPPVQMPTQLTPMDREARVLRYREKKKTRKFEKTIRYASRKAYAETRPRIKGRFAKRTNVDVEVDQMFSTTLMTEGGYGIVPSF